MQHDVLKQRLSRFLTVRLRAETDHMIRRAGLLLVLSLVCAMGHSARAEPGGFEPDCKGFTRDPKLKAMWSAPSDMAPRDAALTAAVPRLSLAGRALAMSVSQPTAAAPASLESIFGMSSDGEREIVETDFYQESRAVVFAPQVIATVSHALTLDRVDVENKKQQIKSTVPLRVTRMRVEVHGSAGEPAVRGNIAHQNEPYDLALVEVQPNAMLRPLPYRAVMSYGTGDPAQPRGGLLAGDCVAAIVPVRDSAYDDTGVHRLAVGKVLARVPVAVNSMTQTKLNINMFTTDMDVQPGDSGSPVLALHQGEPVLVGLVAATMYPAATFTYVTRIDPLIAFAQALQQEQARSRPQAYATEKWSRPSDTAAR